MPISRVSILTLHWQRATNDELRDISPAFSTDAFCKTQPATIVAFQLDFDAAKIRLASSKAKGEIGRRE
jgi:hypothetical protein